jgi:hypothetical protein
MVIFINDQHTDTRLIDPGFAQVRFGRNQNLLTGLEDIAGVENIVGLDLRDR